MRGKREYGNIQLIVRALIRSVNDTEKTPGVLRAAAQYGTASRIIDLATFDITHNPWRCGELFDAIVTDPPCKLTSSCSQYVTRTE